SLPGWFCDCSSLTRGAQPGARAVTISEAAARSPENRAEDTVRAYWILATIIFLNFTAGGATFPFYSLYSTSLGASLGQVALVVGVQSVVSVVAGLFFGRIADRL